MSAPGPWTLCYTPPGGVRSCSYIPLAAEWPDLTDHPDPVILDQIGRLQTLASEVQEPTLKMQLTLALDAVVERVSTQLPAGFEFLRDATHDLPDGDLPYGIVPDVTGAEGFTAQQTLSEAGYVVEVKALTTTDPDQGGIVLDQVPAGGAQYYPPGTVTLFVGALVLNSSGPTTFPPPE
jgi:hypothetical protein